jgi:hypothetical protein
VAVAGRPSDPVLLPQKIEQRKTLFEFFEILAHGAVLPLEANVEEGGQNSQARMVGGEIFSATQGPQYLQNGSQLRERISIVIGGVTVRQPMSEAGERFAEKGKGWLGGVQAVRPATERRGIWYAIRVLESRRRLFPRTMLHKTPPQSLTPR